MYDNWSYIGCIFKGTDEYCTSAPILVWYRKEVPDVLIIFRGVLSGVTKRSDLCTLSTRLVPTVIRLGWIWIVQWRCIGMIYIYIYIYCVQVFEHRMVHWYGKRFSGGYCCKTIFVVVWMDSLVVQTNLLETWYKSVSYQHRGFLKIETPCNSSRPTWYVLSREWKDLELLLIGTRMNNM